jgi:hypothetical protein
MFRKPNQIVTHPMTDRRLTAGYAAACVREANGS